MALIIRESQLAELERKRFEARVIDAIAEREPDARAELEGAEGRRILRTQCAEARGYGLHVDLDVARYVVTAWLLGADFDTRFPAMQQVLASDRLAPPQKAEAIEKIALAVLQELTQGRD